MIDAIQNSVLSATEIDTAVSTLRTLPTVACPVAHHFAPGLYIRELSVQAGSIVVGHQHRTSQVNILLRGTVQLWRDGGFVRLTAPQFLIGPPGAKIAYVEADMVWCNVFATDETDIERLESTLFDRSDACLAYNTAAFDAACQAHQTDRDDYVGMLNDIGWTADAVSEISDRTDDLIDMPQPYAPYIVVRASPIDRYGCFVTIPIEAGRLICPMRIGSSRTPAGRYCNHSAVPNARVVEHDGDLWACAIRNIAGCMGGDAGTEITVDYRQAMAVNKEAA